MINGLYMTNQKYFLQLMIIITYNHKNICRMPNRRLCTLRNTYIHIKIHTLDVPNKTSYVCKILFTITISIVIIKSLFVSGMKAGLFPMVPVHRQDCSAAQTDRQIDR